MRSCFLILFLLAGCATEPDDFRRRNIDEYFNSSGVVQYFLPDLPVWANTVASRQCHRNTSVRFFSFDKMHLSFGLDYHQMLQMQLAYNNERDTLYGKQAITLAQEERLFYTVSERVQSGILPFKTPKFNKINLVIVDEAMLEKDSAKLKKLINQNSFAQAFPVFMSFCHSEKSVRAFIEKLNFTGRFEIIGSAMFSPFSDKNILTAGPMLYLDAFFGKDKEITLYTDKKSSADSDLIGFTRIKNY